jgi:predicted peptidase
MHSYWKTLLGCLLCLGACEALADEPTHLTTGRFHYETRVEADLGYLISLPKDYAKDSTKRWPLVLFLHGAGERGTNLQAVAVHGPPKFAQAGRDLPFILVSPQCPPNTRWQDQVLLGLLDQVTASHRVDTNRVYLTGLSMGGYGTWSLGLKYPQRFAALAPICGGGQLIDVLLADNRRAELQQMPIWAFHGVKDNVVPVSESRQMVKGLQDKGSQVVKLTEYPEAGHDSWTAAYDHPEFFTWLLAQTREGRFNRKP